MVTFWVVKIFSLLHMWNKFTRSVHFSIGTDDSSPVPIENAFKYNRITGRLELLSVVIYINLVLKQNEKLIFNNVKCKQTKWTDHNLFVTYTFFSIQHVHCCTWILLMLSRRHSWLSSCSLSSKKIKIMED